MLLTLLPCWLIDTTVPSHRGIGDCGHWGIDAP
jgi:hypothetical protein